MEIFKRSCKNNLECCCPYILPCRGVTIAFVNAPRMSGMRKTLFIIIESEGRLVCALHHIGLKHGRNGSLEGYFYIVRFILL